MAGVGKEMEIRVDQLARVEGEGGVYLKIKDGRVEYVEVSIFEPPRFFEVILKGRPYLDAPDITARICGICPLAYIMSSARAMEKILGIEVPNEIYRLRRIAYLGEWIESHVLHIALLHAPDFLGFQSALHMAEKHPDIVKDSLSLKAWGNQVIELVGGRPVHPVAFRVGGVYSAVSRHRLLQLLKKVEVMKRKARKLLDFVLSLPIPDVKYTMNYASLRNGVRYPILEGKVVTSNGLVFDEEEFEKYVMTEQMKYSTSLRYKLKEGGAYIVGPFARYNLNFDLLMPEVKDILKEAGYEPPLKNTYQSIIARAAEVYHSVIELEDLIATYKEPDPPYIDAEPREGEAAAITEAPRGMLYHRYRLNNEGKIVYANIVAPTCQNYAAMEEDIKKIVPLLLGRSEEDAKWLVEQTIRNYDPCISCSVHTLRIKIIKE